MSSTTLAAPSHSYRSEEDLQEQYHAQGWTDGLPIVAPTPDRVEVFLAEAGLAPDLLLGEVPTREVRVTAEHAAINAVMAGCRPEYFPVVVAALRAHLHEKGNCHSTTGTLSGAVQTVLVNGPIRTRIGIECGAGCMGPGFRANATIGRALRLVIRNVCRAIPGVLDRASFSSPHRFSFCFGENEEESDWTPLHVERGYQLAQSTVTVHSVMTVTSTIDFTSRTPEALLDSMLHTLRQNGIAGDDFVGDDANVMLVVGPEHRRYFDRAGWSKEDMRDYLFPRFVEDPGPTGRIVGIPRKDGILIAAAGGDGMAQTWVLLPHLAVAITEAIDVPN
ncbi:hypothetical protein N8077_04340 [Myxococcota bacterium]|nr:hypothetical protein [Myxococcota bacterium]